MKLEDVKKLAEMSRIDMSETELQAIANDFDAILAYVGQVQEASQIAPSSDKTKDLNITNVMRDDIVTNEAGFYSDKIIAEMPDTEKNFLKVNQIL